MEKTMNNTEPFTLLYAEDDDATRSGYMKYFKTIFQTVYEASHGQEAYNLYIEYNPDVLLLDINMPHIDGLTLVSKIRDLDKDVKIIILTAHLDQEKLLKAIPLGLVGYLKKPVQKRELESILKKTLAKLKVENSQVLNFSDSIFFDKVSNKLFNSEEEIHLTKNEIILIHFLSSKFKIAYSIEDIIDEYWHMSSQKNMSQDSIRNIIKRLKPKLPENAIKNNYGLGYQFVLKD